MKNHIAVLTFALLLGLPCACGGNDEAAAKSNSLALAGAPQDFESQYMQGGDNCVIDIRPEAGEVDVDLLFADLGGVAVEEQRITVVPRAGKKVRIGDHAGTPLIPDELPPTGCRILVRHDIARNTMTATIQIASKPDVVHTMTYRETYAASSRARSPSTRRMSDTKTRFNVYFDGRVGALSVVES